MSSPGDIKGGVEFLQLLLGAADVDEDSLKRLAETSPVLRDLLLFDGAPPSEATTEEIQKQFPLPEKP